MAGWRLHGAAIDQVLVRVGEEVANLGTVATREQLSGVTDAVAAWRSGMAEIDAAAVECAAFPF